MKKENNTHELLEGPGTDIQEETKEDVNDPDFFTPNHNKDNRIIKQTFDLAAPQQALEVATILQKFVADKKLTANIQGKQYPLVEAWQFAGSQLGLYPLLIDVKDLSNEQEIKYMAIVEVRKVVGNDLMGKGVAICSNKEFSKKKFDEYAILSMAQTRATGKAFRNLLAWLMKAAGFEATPAEEMDFKKQDEQDIDDVPTEMERKLLMSLVYVSDLTDEEKEKAFEAINTCNNYKQFEKLQHRLEERRMPIDQVVNPSQKDINQHIKKITANGK